MSKKKVLFIINPRAGIGYYKKVVRLVKKQLNEDIYDYQLRLTRYRGHGHVLATEAAENNIDVVENYDNTSVTNNNGNTTNNTDTTTNNLGDEIVNLAETATITNNFDGDVNNNYSDTYEENI